MKIQLERRDMALPEFAQSVFHNAQSIQFEVQPDGKETPIVQIMINGQLTMLGTYTSVLAHLMKENGYSFHEQVMYFIAAFGLQKVKEDLFNTFCNLWLLILNRPTDVITIEVELS